MPDQIARITHGRHCTCSPCAREDWTNPDFAPCGMHGEDCPALYQPWGPAGSPVPGMPVQTDTFTALCVEDKCPWKHRGVTGPATNLRGQEHADASGHNVTVYFEHRWTLEPNR